MKHFAYKIRQVLPHNTARIPYAAVWILAAAILFLGSHSLTARAASRKSLASCDASLSCLSAYYTGQRIRPSVTITRNTTTLTKDKDYTVSYKNNRLLGKATVTVTGKGSYYGQRKLYFTITARPISQCDVTISPTFYTYDGTAKKPSVTVKNGSGKLTYGTSYTLKYTDNTKAGIAKIKIKGKRNFTGSYTKTFIIRPRNVSIKSATRANTSITLKWNARSEADGYYIYQYSTSKKAWEKIATATKSATSYKVSGLSTGTPYTFGIKAYNKSNNTTVLSESYGRISQSTTLPAVKNLKVTDQTYEALYLSWDKVSGANGYAFYQYNSETNSYTEIKRVYYNTGSCTIHGLKGATLYNIAVRAYKTTSGTTVASKSYSLATGKTCKDYSSQTLYVDGDSIAYGTGAGGYSYADALAKKYGFQLTKVPVPGALLSSSYPNKGHIAESVLSHVTTTYNYAIIDGGLNDYYRSVPFGTISSSTTTGTLDINTTCGALETIFRHFKTKYPQTKVYFLIPNKIWDNKEGFGNISAVENDIGLTYVSYYNAFITICKKYNVTVIDCYKNCTFDTSDEAIRKLYMSADGVHPLKTTQINEYLPVAEEAMNLQ